MKCPICNKELVERSFITHLTRIHNDVFKTDDERQKIKIDLLFDKIQINDVIIKYNDGYSILEISKIFDIKYKNVEQILKQNNIELRSMSDQIKTDITQEKTINTTQERYGVDNASQSIEIKNKKKETFLSNYGVDNIWKLTDYYIWMNEYMLSTYGQKRITNSDKILETRNNWDDDKYKEWCKKISNAKIREWENMSEEDKQIRITRLLNITTSSIETKIGNLLLELNIPFTTQYKINNRYFDFLINDTQIIIEVNGDYWHANPEKYKENDILNLGRGKLMSAKQIWVKDKKKNTQAINKGYKVLIIWEKYIRKTSDLELKEYLLNKIMNI